MQQKNYQQAIEIYSNILNDCKAKFSFSMSFSFFFFKIVNDEHLALYGRAKSYFASKELSKALEDIERVILLKTTMGKK